MERIERSPILENVSDFLRKLGMPIDDSSPEIKEEFEAPATQMPAETPALDLPFIDPVAEEDLPEELPEEEYEESGIETPEDEINEPVPAGLEQQLRDFIKNNPNLDDARMHKFADLIGVNKHEVEEAVYKMLYQYMAAENAPAEPEYEEEPEPEFEEPTYEEPTYEEPEYEDEWNESTDESLVIESVGMEKFKKLSREQKIAVKAKALKLKAAAKAKEDKLKLAAKTKALKVKGKLGASKKSK